MRPFITSGTTLSTALALLVAAAGCGKSDSNDGDEGTPAAATAQGGADTGSAAQLAQGLSQMANALGAATGGGNAKPVDPVNFRDLQALLPDMRGWDKGQLAGQRATSPVAHSMAEATYTRGDANVEAKIVDSGFNQLLLAGVSMYLRGGFERETVTGYEKSVEVDKHPGWEKWDRGSKRGELHLLVGKRFLVSFEGSQLDDTKPLHELADKMDMGKLASLK